MIVPVTLLDGNEVRFELDGKSSGDDLLVKVAEHVQLTEKDYFGFLHVDSRDKTLTWLHGDRTLAKQLKEDKKCFFQVKFYPPEPAQLQEYLTRYQMVTQNIKFQGCSTSLNTECNFFPNELTHFNIIFTN